MYKEPLFTLDAVRRTVHHKRKPPHFTGGAPQQYTYRSLPGGPKLARSVLQCRSDHGKAIHPTQKPVEIVAKMLRYACPPGGLVLDPFAGSGVTGMAARTLGRRAFLIEKDPDFYAAALDRLAADVPLLQAAE